MRWTHRTQVYGRENESWGSWLSNEPKIEPWEWIVEKLQSWKVATSIVVLKVSFDSPPRSERVKQPFKATFLRLLRQFLSNFPRKPKAGLLIKNINQNLHSLFCYINVNQYLQKKTIDINQNLHSIFCISMLINISKKRNYWHKHTRPKEKKAQYFR